MRKILIVTGSRGEYGYIRPVLRLIDSHPGLSYVLVVTNMHLLPEFGASVNSFAKDGFKVHYELYMALDGNTSASMTKSLAVFLMSVTDAIHNEKPDIILLAGDRGEQLMAAIAGAHMNIPVAHIQAGELSGNIDGLTRHAIARYAHIHFAANADAADRLIRSGEQPARVHRVGAPQLDELIAGDALSKEDLIKRFHLSPSVPLAVVLQHPITEQYESAAEQMRITLSALVKTEVQSVLIYPNNDAGSAMTRQVIGEFLGPRLHVERNVSREIFGGLLRSAHFIIGNSSSGILEAPSFQLPAINIGRRQEGRMQAPNVVNVPHDINAICDAINAVLAPSFRESLKHITNPYGDGCASRRIVDILASIDLDEELLFKRLTY